MTYEEYIEKVQANALPIKLGSIEIKVSVANWGHNRPLSEAQFNEIHRVLSVLVHGTGEIEHAIRKLCEKASPGCANGICFQVNGAV